MNTSLIGQKVWVLQRSGHHKIGVLKSLAENFIVLQTFDGEEIVLSTREIAKIERFREKGGWNGENKI
jgi:hypothetical protein